MLRNGLDLYANVRPVELLPGIASRLRAEPGSIDYVIVRENTEGLYLARGTRHRQQPRDDRHAAGHPGRAASGSRGSRSSWPAAATAPPPTGSAG